MADFDVILSTERGVSLHFERADSHEHAVEQAAVRVHPQPEDGDVLFVMGDDTAGPIVVYRFGTCEVSEGEDDRGWVQMVSAAEISAALEPNRSLL